jgi:carboxyl-terminal processing protease
MPGFPPPPGPSLLRLRLLRLGRLAAWSALVTAGSLAVFRGAAASKDPAGAYKKLDVFTHVLSLIENNYVESVDETRLLYGAIDGMVRTLDPHSTFMDPRAYASLKQETDGEYGGIGMDVAIKNGDLTVVTPIDDTPASRAGLKPGDKLVEIDGQPTRGMKEADAMRALMGPPGTQVVLKIGRESWRELRSFTLLRDVIRVVSVEERLYAEPKGAFGYVKIKNFQDRTDSYLKKALDSMRSQAGGKLDGLVLDLRHNPGGLLDQAVKVADRFLLEGVIVTTKGRGGKHVEVERAHVKDTEPGYPLIVLVDGGTASASEIVAGALQDHKRAVVLGTPTFGKGSVQTVIELEDGSGLKLTIARYYTPSGRSIQERGITPDIFVRQSAGPAEEDGVREQNLPNHFRGEDPSRDKVVAGQAELPAQQSEPPAVLAPPTPLSVSARAVSDDFQLRTALDTLRTWQVFNGTHGDGRPVSIDR